MDLYPLPDNLRPVPPGPGSTSTRDYWTALAAEGQCELLHEPAEGATLGYAPPVYEQRAGRWLAVAYALGTPEERAAAQVAAARAATVVSRFQARAALYQAGLLDQVEALMADPATPAIARLAWQDADEFLRLSPTVLAMAAALGLDDAALDELFATAATITA